MDNIGCICQAMKRLQKEQEIISWNDIEFQFICKPKRMDTIPFLLYSNENITPFVAHFKCVETPYFRLEKMDEERCCAELSLLEAIDMEGNPADCLDDIYTLRKTKGRIIVSLNFFCVINPLPPELVNRPLPIIEPNC